LEKLSSPFSLFSGSEFGHRAQRILCTGVFLCSCTASFTFGLALAPEHQKSTFLRTDELRMAQTLQGIRHSTSTPKPRVLGSSPSTPGCEIPRKPFRYWRSGFFPCAQILCLSVMVLPFFARFCLVFHRRSIKNAPGVLAECGRTVVGVCLARTCGGRSSGVAGGS